MTNSSKTPGETADSKKRIEEVLEAAREGSSPVEVVAEQAMSAEGAEPANESDKAVLQSVAHGAEGFGSSYGAGPSVPHRDGERQAMRPGTGDSASPAASALKTRRPPGAKRPRT